MAAMDAIWDHLRLAYGAHLLWPSYTQVDDSIGYVTRVYPGVKENGSIFSHPNAWPVIAEAMLGRGNRAWEYYLTMAPTRFNDRTEVRRAEPYAYCQFLYGRDHPWFGRAENPWLTGTAGWMYAAATQHILGVRPAWDALLVDPCIPPDWGGFTVTRQWRGGTYRITVENPDSVSAGVARAMLTAQSGDGSSTIRGTDPAADLATLAAGHLLPIAADPRTGRRVARLPEAPGQTVDVLTTLGDGPAV
jgi:N,N'-diacetylchitobiose phosphorylase